VRVGKVFILRTEVGTKFCLKPYSLYSGVIMCVSVCVCVCVCVFRR
jgi:hypothetical protein